MKPGNQTLWVLGNFLWMMLSTQGFGIAKTEDHIETSSTSDPDRLSLVQEDLAFLKEEELVYTAIRQEQPISEAPSNMFVITAEDIRHSGATDIPTLLRSVPGMEVMQMTGADFNVSVRGDNQTNANKLLVQVDGRSIYIDASGAVFWRLIPVTLPEIERIEVLKGPAGTIHGFNAFDGVVNIITKSPSVKQGTTLQVVGGEFGTFNTAAILAGKHDRLGYRLSFGQEQNQQWRDRDALAFRDYKVNLLTEYKLATDRLIRVTGGWLDTNKFDGTVTQVTRNSTEATFGYAKAAYESPNLEIQGFWNGTYPDTKLITNPLLRGFLQSMSWDGNITAHHDINTYDVLMQYKNHLGDAHKWLAGINYRLNTANSNILDKFSREHRFGVYMEDTWSALETVSVTAGIRYDLDTFINPTISPRVTFLWRPLTDHAFRFGLSLGYRPPTLDTTHLDVRTQLNLPPPIGPQTFPTVGSDSLDPEQIISYEAEYQGWYWQHRLRVRGAGFYNHLSDLIEFVQTGPTPTDPVYATNSGEADIFGAELGMEFWATPWLSGFVNGAYQTIGQTIRGINERAGPQWKINGGLRLQSGMGLSGQALVHYVGPTTYPLASAFNTLAPFGVTAPDARVGGYTLLNLRAGYSFWKDKAEVAFSAFNALNDRHREHPLGDTIKSRVLFWLTVRY